MEKIAERIYRMIEAIDGEKNKQIKIIPYKLAECIKLYALRWIK